jgi:general secretion pathway protein G
MEIGPPPARGRPGSAKRQVGFTILEILIVFVLIAGLMAFVGPRIFETLGRAKSQEAKIRLMDLSQQIELYRLEVGKYPGSLQDLVRQPSGVDKWNGPYVKNPDLLKDAWGNDYRYQVPGQSKPFDLISLGADGREGGDGENKDIANQ